MTGPRFKSYNLKFNFCAQTQYVITVSMGCFEIKFIYTDCNSQLKIEFGLCIFTEADNISMRNVLFKNYVQGLQFSKFHFKSCYIAFSNLK